ncbi:hypothetical protein DVH24_002705 [Malus domestica]|uniref:Uncharacterized protein n=1 Tax=Malus domestica TaxID=3750 RepID=A0A498K5P3_MALDO|nr:hypothetical protein DVH24_002705 [Malus domestica]
MVKLAFSISFSNPHCLFRLADSRRPYENDSLASILSSSRRRLPSRGRVLCVCGHHQLLDSLTPVLRDFKSYFSVKEIAIPVHSNIEASYAAHPIADVFINFASYRRVVAIIAEGVPESAEGVPESDTKQLIAYARVTNKVVIGSATVGGIQAGAFKIGDTAETINNFIPLLSLCNTYGEAVDTSVISEVYALRIAVERQRISLNNAGRLPINKIRDPNLNRAEISDLPVEDKSHTLLVEALHGQTKKFNTIVAVRPI